MNEPTLPQIRSFRLKNHHLDQKQAASLKSVQSLSAACGFQNTPPGAWETALYNRLQNPDPVWLQSLLSQENLLVQAWSIRGVPMIFPLEDSPVFLSALIPKEGEPWIYTRGITLALDYLGISFQQALDWLLQVIVGLDFLSLVSKTVLDETLARWILPLVPQDKQALWSAPSMYGKPDQQTVGGAVVSFLLRPCSFLGLVVFSGRQGSQPVFTSFKQKTGRPLTPSPEGEKELVRRYLHCYGPATPAMFASWLGASNQQANRLWNTVAEELEPVTLSGKKAFILAQDHGALFSEPSFDQELLLLGGHDPYLDQRDRWVLQEDRAWQRKIWTTVSNPGAVLYRGEAIGIWTGKKKSKGLEIHFSLRNDISEKEKLQDLARSYAAFRGQELLKVIFISP